MHSVQNPVSSPVSNNGSRSRSVATSSPQNVRSQVGERNEELSIWIRLGLPISLALVAAVLNAAAVRSQIQPIYAYAVANDIPAGTRLRAEHLTGVELAGNMDRSFLALPNDILVKTNEHGQLSLEQSLEQQPRVLSKPMGKGELLSLVCLGGLDLSELRSNDQGSEQMVDLPREKIMGNGSGLLPGKLVYFLVKRRHSQDEASREIGPFRVGLREIDSKTSGAASGDSGKSDLPIVYRVDKHGEPTPHSRELLDAIQNGSSLTIIHKSNKR